MRSNRSVWTKSTVHLAFGRQQGRQDRHHVGETGLVTSERFARLCGDHSEHVYDVLRITTHGTACISVCYHADVPNVLVCSTTINSVAQYDTFRSACISYQPKGPKRCSNSFTPSLSHVAVYGDPVAPAIELQLCHCNKFTWLEGHTTEVRCCSISKDGSTIISGGRDGQAYLWLVTQPDGPSGDPVVKRFTLPGHGFSQVKTCCISSNGGWAATASTDGQVLLWDLTGVQQPAPADEDVVTAASNIRTSDPSVTDRTASAGSVQLAAVFTLPRDKANDYATALDLSSDGSWLAVGCRTGKVFIVGPNRQQLQQLPLRHQDGSKVRCCAFSPDGSKLVTAGDDGRMVLWDVGSSSWVLTAHEHFKPIHGCCWSPDGSRIVTTGMDTLICIMELVLLTMQHKLRVPLRLETGTATEAANTSTEGMQDAATLPSSPSKAATASARQQHPLLRKALAGDEDSKFLACVPVTLHRKIRSHQNTLAQALCGSADGGESVLCVDQTGKIQVLHPGQDTVATADIAMGSSIFCCSFDGSILAAAKRDGAVTALSCATAVAARRSLDGSPVLEAQWDPPVAVSAKLNMLVNGVSISSHLGRVALVGTDRKVHQTGVLWLWEYDPSVRPVNITDGAEAQESHASRGLDSSVYRLGSRGSGQVSSGSGDSRANSLVSPRMSDSITRDDSDGNRLIAAQLGGIGTDGGLPADHLHRSGHGCGSAAAAAIGPDGWIWHCENPVKVLTAVDTPLQCCSFSKGEGTRLAVGTSAGWLAVVNLAGEYMEGTWTRYQIHTCEVSAVDFAADGATIVSGDVEGRVVMWSHVTGFKLAVWTLHSAAIRSLAFSQDHTMVAVGDAAGIVSSWDVGQSCLITAAQAHDGPATSVDWMSSTNSLGTSSIVSCGYDGTIGTLQIDPGIYKLYRAAFRGLYHSCKRNHKVHKLEVALNWHLTQGALQDASVLQLLVNTAAADGNVIVLGLVLPLFERMGWLLHFGSVFAAPRSATIKKIDSDKSINLARKSMFSLARGDHTGTGAATAAGDLSEYAIHPHDLLLDHLDDSRRGTRETVGKGNSRRGTRDAFSKDKQGSKHNRNESFAFPTAAGERILSSAGRGSRWAHSVADISRLLAFQGQPQRSRQQQEQQQRRASQPETAATSYVAPGRLAAVGLAQGPAVGRHSRHSSGAGSSTAGEAVGGTQGAAAAAIAAGASSGVDDSDKPESNSPRAYDSSGSEISPRVTPSHTPTRLLSPINSRNARTPAMLPSLDTLHEESHIHVSNTSSADVDDSKALSVRSRPTDPAAADSSGSAPATPHVGVAITADDDNSDSLSSKSGTQGRAPQTGSSGGGVSNGSPLQRQHSSSPRASRGPSPFQQQEPNNLLQRQGNSLPPRPLQQQSSNLRPTMGRQLLRFLSGKRLAISSGGSEDPADFELGGADVSMPAGRQRSLSEGASLAQRLSAYKTLNFSGKETHSNSSPGSMRESPLAAESHIALGITSPTSGHPVIGTGFGSVIAAASAAARHQQHTSSDAYWDSSGEAPNLDDHDKAPLSAQSSRRRTTVQDLLLRFTMSRRSRSNVGGSSMGAAASETGAKNPIPALSGFSGVSGGSRVGEGALNASGRKLANLFSWNNWGRSKAYQAQLSVPALAPQQQPAGKPNKDQQHNRDDLLQMAMASQQAQCVRLVVDTLLAGRFSKVSVVLHMYDALQALIHDAQHKRACRRLLKHLPMIDNGEVEVDSLLTHNTKILYKCSTNGHPGNLWASATSSQQPLLDALDVLMKRASWRDSIAALIMWPVLWSLKHLGKAWLWLWARQGLGSKSRVQVSAHTKLVPVAHAAEIRAGSRGNLLRQLVSANVDADLYGRELVRAIINVKWDSFARAFLLMQGVQFFAFLVLFLAYLFVAVYGSDPEWDTAQMLASSQGKAALALECILMLMMFGQAADEGKQIVTYGRDYFNSPWNYMDVASCGIIGILFLLHISRLNHQLFVVLVALEVLLLCLRSLYFCMALDQIGALLRMVLIVIKDMRYFFMMLLFLLISFGLTFSVLMSPASKARLNLVSAVASNEVNAAAEVQVFGSLEDSMTQLFTIMFGDIQFSTLKTIMSVNTVASRLAVVLACVYAVLVLIVLVNLLIAIVDETYGTVKESEADQMLRNKALIIDEIESTLTDAVIEDLNSRVLLPYVHILIPQAARADAGYGRRDLHAKFRKLKLFLKQRLPEPGLPGSYSTESGLISMPSISTGVHVGSIASWQQQQQVMQRRNSLGLAVPQQQSSSSGAAAATAKIQQEVSQLSSSVTALNQQLETVSNSNTAAVAELASKVEAMQGDIGQIKELLMTLVDRQQG